jgi:deoxyribose-phosphate aldolase
MENSTSLKSLSKMIDHSLLHPTMTDKIIASGCELARLYDVATACVKPYAIPLAKSILEGSDVGVCAVIAFPHGNSLTAIKLLEAGAAVDAGAAEIDMVINIGKALGGDWAYVSEEIRKINEFVVSSSAILKVIFENDYLEDAQIIRLCEICSEHAVAFIKTSTGYGFVKQPNGFYSYAGSTDYALRLMRAHQAQGVISGFNV